MGKFSEYKIRLKSMPQGTQEFEYHLGKQFLSTWRVPIFTTLT